MKNIFKTTLKKDIIANIVDNDIREVRFPITKFWATRLTDKYNIEEKSFEFKIFNSLVFSSPSNKETEGSTYMFDFVKTYVDGEEFVVEFIDIKDGVYVNEEIEYVEQNTEEKDIQKFVQELLEADVDNCEIINLEDSDVEINEYDDDLKDFNILDEDLLVLLNQWFDEDKVLESFYADEFVFATNARQVIVLPNGKILGFNKSLPVNNDAQVRIEFDSSEKVYFYENQNFDDFKDSVLKTIEKIKKNNFVFIWKRYTGIFIDEFGRIYFGIKYSTRKSIGFNRKYNVQ